MQKVKLIIDAECTDSVDLDGVLAKKIAKAIRDGQGEVLSDLLFNELSLDGSIVVKFQVDDKIVARGVEE